jgi:AcrR family transcriptional regulator
MSRSIQSVQTTSDRTTDLLDATCRVVAKSGAHGLRMSHVAREAGVSNALLHYYFETRAELLARAFAHAEDRVYAHAGVELEELETAAERLRRFLHLYVEDDVVFQENWVLWNEMWSSSLSDPDMRPTIEEGYRRWIAYIVDLVEQGRTDGSVPPAVDPKEAGARLAAVVDGIGSQLVLGLVARDRAAALIEQSIELELTGRTPPGPA